MLVRLFLSFVSVGGGVRGGHTSAFASALLTCILCIYTVYICLPALLLLLCLSVS